MKVIEEHKQAEHPDAEALIKEAGQRQHRRRLVLAVVAIVVIAGASTAVAILTNRPSAHNVGVPSSKPKVAGPIGKVVSLKQGPRRQPNRSALCRGRAAPRGSRPSRQRPVPRRGR